MYPDIVTEIQNSQSSTKIQLKSCYISVTIKRNLR